MNLSDRDLLAKTIMAEAGNQGRVGMLGVGAVIMNRLRSPSFGNTFKDVILKPGQFSPWNSVTGHAGGAQGQNMAKLQPSADAYAVADQILSGSYTDPTKGALNFYNPSISNPSWGQSAGGDWLRLGDHLFGTAGQKKKDTSMLPTTPTSAPVTPQVAPNVPDQAQSNQPPKPRGLFDIIGKAVGGGFENLKGAITGSNPEASDRLAIALMSLSGNPDQLKPLMTMAANDIQERAKTKTQNKTVELIKSIDPTLGAMAEANPDMAGNIMSAIASKQLDPAKGGRILTAAQMRELFPNTEIADGVYNVKEENGKIVSATKIGGGGTVNQITMPGSPGAEEDLLKKLMEAQGTEWAGMLKQGSAAAQLSVDLEVLAALAPLAPSGPLQGRLAEAFPEFNDVSALRQSIIKRIAPTLRVEGSGSTSDIEFNAMLDGFGSLKNSTEANQAIISIFQKKAAFDVARAKIVRDYTTKKITYDQANSQMEALEQQSLIPREVAALMQKFKAGDDAPNTGPKRLRWNPETRQFE